MTVENMEGLVEATRVYGNLSRERRVRDFLMENKGMQHVTNITSSFNNL